jgi:hypothetical protein
MSKSTKKKTDALPKTIDEAPKRGFHQDGGIHQYSEDYLTQDGELDFVSDRSEVSFCIPYTATLKFGRPRVGDSSFERVKKMAANATERNAS